MKFLCGSCRTKYQISDEKVRGKILTIRCKKCGAKIIVRESLVREGGEGTVVAPVAEEPRSTPFNPRLASGSGALSQAFSQALESGTQDVPIESERPPTAFEWFTAVDGRQQGPFAFDHVANQVRSGVLQGRHYVWHEGMEHWRRIRDVEQLRRFEESATPPPPPPADRSVGLELDRTTAEPEVAPMAGIAASELPTTATQSTLFGDGTAASDGASPLAAGQAPASSAHELDELSDAEDLFASVPRATAAELVQKESTRFFVNAAGVRGVKNLNRLGFILGAALFLLLGGLVAGAATGVIEINIPGFGNPFADDGEGMALLSGERDDPNSLKFLGEEKKLPKPTIRRPTGGRRVAPPSEASSEGFELGGDYVEDESSAGGPRGGRGVEGARFEIGDVTTGGGVRESSVGDIDLPNSEGPEVPVVATRKLSDEAIQRTVNAGKRSVKICYEQSLKGQQNLSGRLEIEVRVEPSGQVSKTSVKTAQFRSSRIGKCIADKIRDWRFPPFEGEAEEFEVPFVLSRGSY